jgi:hypothetical protein
VTGRRRLVLGPLTRAERERAYWEVYCAKCGAEPGHPCHRPRGGKGHHRERKRAVALSRPEDMRWLLTRPVRRHDGFVAGSRLPRCL